MVEAYETALSQCRVAANARNDKEMRAAFEVALRGLEKNTQRGERDFQTSFLMSSIRSAIQGDYKPLRDIMNKDVDRKSTASAREMRRCVNAAIRGTLAKDGKLAAAMTPANRSKLMAEIARLNDKQSPVYNPTLAAVLQRELSLASLLERPLADEADYDLRDETTNDPALWAEEKKASFWACVLGVIGLPFGFVPGVILFAITFHVMRPLHNERKRNLTEAQRNRLRNDPALRQKAITEQEIDRIMYPHPVDRFFA